MTKKIAITKKPFSPRATWNWLLGAKCRADSTGLVGRGLLFKTDVEFKDDQIADAPKGYFPSSYTAIANPNKIDPTCEQIIGRELLEETDVVSSNVGRASIHAERVGQSFISAQFGEFVREWELLAAMALTAEANMKAGTRVKISESRNIYEGDGDIMAFLAATGELVGTEFGFSEMDNVDVAKIVTRAAALINENIAALTELDYREGYDHLDDAIGMGTMPHDGTPAVLLRAGTYETLFESPLRRVMRTHHGRMLYKPILKSRIPDKGVYGEQEDFILVEGNDQIIFPAAIMVQVSGFEQLFDLLTDIMVDVEESRVAHKDYERNHVEFTDQFLTSGDLVQAIYVDRTVTPWAQSNLEVALGPITGEIINGIAGMRISEHIPGTGGLGSVSFVRNGAFNFITGMDQYYIDYEQDPLAGTMNGGESDLSIMCQLPNGILDLSSPAFCTLSNWLELLAWYKGSQSDELRYLNANTSPLQTKQLYKLGSSARTLSNSAESMAAIIANSQRNGTLTKCYASFNTIKVAEPGQQGPVLADASLGSVGFTPIAGLNGWTRADKSQIRLTDFQGRRLTLPDSSSVCSSFSGEMQSEKAPSGLITPRVPSSGQFGTSDIDRAISRNLASMPLSLDGRSVLPTSFGVSDNTRREDVAKQMLTDKTIAASGWLSLNMDLLTGFKRGLVHGKSITPGNHNASGSMVDKLTGWSREGTSVATATSWSWANTAYPNVHAGATISETSIEHPSFAGVLPGHVALSDLLSQGIEFQHHDYKDMTNGENTPKRTWYWDPSRTPAVGATNRLIYGHMYDDVVLSAAQSYYPEVAVGAIKTHDIQSDVNSEMTNCKVAIMAKDGSLVNPPRFNSMSGIGRDEQVDIAFLDGRVEQDFGAYPAVMFNHGWSDQLDLISETAGSMHMTEFGLNVIGSIYDDFDQGSNIHQTTLSGNRSGYVPTLSIPRRNYSTTNGCTRHNFNLFSMPTLNTANGIRAAQVVFPERKGSGNDMVSLENWFDGPNPAPMNADANVLIIGGHGVCRDYGMAHYALSPISWLMSTLTGLDESSDGAAYPMAAHGTSRTSPGYGDRDKVEVVLPTIPSISTSIGGVSSFAAITYGIGATSSPNEWFLDAEASGLLSFGFVTTSNVSSIVPINHQDMRSDKSASAVSNPWKRAGNEGYGMETLKYDPHVASRAIQVKLAADLRDRARSLRAPYSNDLFRDLQSQGV